MLRNYPVIAMRDIVRNKLYSLINIVGLAVGLACAIFIALYLRDELSYDKWIPDSQNIYRVEGTFYYDDGRSELFPYTPAPPPGHRRVTVFVHARRVANASPIRVLRYE